MTKEEAIMVLKNEQPHCGKKALFSEGKRYEAYDVAIKALEQEPCDDAISRQAAIDACLNGWNKDYKEIVEEIRTLPPVTPQPKTDVLDKIIDEIENTEIKGYIRDVECYNAGINFALHIIAKHKAESEEN